MDKCVQYFEVEDETRHEMKFWGRTYKEKELTDKLHWTVWLGELTLGDKADPCEHGTCL